MAELAGGFVRLTFGWKAWREMPGQQKRCRRRMGKNMNCECCILNLTHLPSSSGK